MSDWSRLTEALDYMKWIGSVASDWPSIEEHVSLLAAAASQWRDLFAVCPTCHGLGHYRGIDGDFPEEPCPKCRGGLVLNPDMVERGVDAVPDWIKPVVDDNISGELALDALVALILWAALSEEDE